MRIFAARRTLPIVGRYQGSMPTYSPISCHFQMISYCRFVPFKATLPWCGRVAGHTAGHTGCGMGVGNGVSFTEEGGHRWKLRWRERTPEGDWRSRALRVEGSAIERDRLVVEIRAALAATGRYTLDASGVLPQEPASLKDLLDACIATRTAAAKYTGKTAQTYTAYTTRVLERIREVERLPQEDVVSVLSLSRDLFDRVQALDAARGSSAMMRYAPLRFALDAWRWGADANAEAAAAGRPLRWPHLPPAPRLTKDYLPQTPVYGRTIAPTLDHIDAVVRRLWARPKVDHGTKVAALLMRYTGLRSDQVFSIARADLDLAARTLVVRAGKTKVEKADARTVPLSVNLLAEPGVLAWIESFPSGPVFPKRRHAKTKDRDEGRTKKPTETFRMTWQEATDAGEVPLHVWAPPNRVISRPEHSFRAAFQAHLEEVRVAGNVIDFLVGHEGDSVREVHYGRELLVAAREAVDGIPPVRWTSGYAQAP
jgi:integrase